MNREAHERRVDSVLDRALAPQSAEPRPGFEERLLANLAVQPERRRWWWWMWVPALAAATVLAIVIGLQNGRRAAPVIDAHRTMKPPEQPVVAEKRPVQLPQVVRHKVSRHSQEHIQLSRATPPPSNLPKQEVFPTPVPATEQERLLLSLVHRRPQFVQKIAAEQEADRQQIQKYFESGPSSSEPAPAQQMR